MSLTARTLARTPAIVMTITAVLATQGCTNPFEKGANIGIVISGAEAPREGIILDSIADAAVTENAAIAPINAGINALDVTDKGVTITYTCFYGASTPCSSLPGVMSFDSATGLLTWTPDYTAAGVYNFTIVGTAGLLSDSEKFVITVANVNRAPVLDAIADASVAEMSAMTAIDAADGANDFDVDSDPVTYTCSYNAGTNCTSLPGTMTFTAATGALTWTPDYSASGVYNFTITGSDGSLSDTEDFAITVTHVNAPPVLDAIADETVNENAAIAAINAADGANDLDFDSQAITYTCTYNGGTNCTGLPGAKSFTAGTGAFTWTPDYSASGVYNFTITGSDGALSDGEDFTITVNNVNRAPVVDAIGNETINENAAMTAINAADGVDDFDVDGQAVTYTCTYNGGTNCTGLPGAKSFTAATGAFTWTPDYTAAGTYNFTITGSDGVLSDGEDFTITVSNVNRAPVVDAIADETVNENAAITAINAADGANDFDIDLDAVTYTCTYNAGTNCTSLPGAKSFTAATGAFTWTPDYTAAGVYNFTITGSDGSLSDGEDFAITVTNVNRAPVLDAIADETVNENAAMTAINAADGADDFDADGDAVTYTCTYNGGTNCTSLPGAKSFTAGTGALTWTPDFSGAGTYNFTITGSDGSLSDGEDFTITVTHVNAPPVLDAIADETVNENAAITAINAADGADDFDVDSQAVTYTCTYNAGTNCTSLPGAKSFTAGTGALTWTPDYTAAGVYNFTITGSDGVLSDGEDFTITVSNVNRAPVLDAIADETVNENAAITAINAADGADDFDADGDAVTYTCTYNGGTNCTSLPGAKSFTAGTGAFTWTPDYTAAGIYNFTITGSDGSLSDGEDFAITVNNTNRAPVVDAIADETVNENAAITAINAADGADDLDIDLEAVTYTCTYNAGTNCTSLPGVKSFTAGTGALTWTPDYTAAGVYNFTITGSDGALSDGEDFTITVNNVNRAPVLDAIADETVNENAAITAINAADGADDLDIDLEAVTYTCTYNGGTNCTSLPGAKSFTAGTGALTWTPDYTAAGVYSFTITGSDGSLSDGEDFAITVTNVNQLPVASNITPSSGHTNIQSVVTLSYTDGDGDLATGCTLSALSNVTVTSACSCDIGGVCTVGVTSTLNTIGAAGFSYTVTDLGGNSNTATATYTIKNAFVSVWRTTGASESITIPLQAGFTYNAKVQWGDGSGLSDITSDADVDRTHIYTAAGDYTVTISGTFQSIFFNNDGDRLKILQVTDLGDVGWTSFFSAFYGCENLTTFAGGNTATVTNMSMMFAAATSVTPDTSGWDTSAVTDMSYLFGYAFLANPNTTSWNTAAVTNMQGMFYGALVATPTTATSGNIWNTGSVTDMSLMFSYAPLANPDTTDWNTGAVTNMANMFEGATSATLTAGRTTNWNTSSVTDMNSMFRDATVANPDTSTWNTAAVTTMASMFEGATSANPDTSTWNTAAVTSMDRMFKAATSANPTTTTSGNIWNTGSVITMSYMFDGATSANPDTSNWNTAAVTTMAWMFSGATSANPTTTTSGNIWNTANVIDMEGMFNNASSANPDMSNWSFAAIAAMANMLNGSATSNANYSALLNRIVATNPYNGMSLGGGAAQYEAGAAAARATLVGRSWIITDGGAAP